MLDPTFSIALPPGSYARNSNIRSLVEEKERRERRKAQKEKNGRGRHRNAVKRAQSFNTPMDLHQMSQGKGSTSTLLSSPVNVHSQVRVQQHASGITREQLRTPNKLRDFGSTGKALERLTRGHNKESMSVLSMGHRIEVKDANAASNTRRGRSRHRRYKRR